MALWSEETPWLTGAQWKSAAVAGGPLAPDVDRVKRKVETATVSFLTVSLHY